MNNELPISPRQRELLVALASGLNNPDIAELLQCSEKTVQNEVSLLTKALRVKNRAQAVAMYLRPRLDLREPASPMVNLERFPTYVIGDQPETCRGCGQRTEFLELWLGRHKYQLHACESCKAAFMVAV